MYETAMGQAWDSLALLTAAEIAVATQKGWTVA